MTRSLALAATAFVISPASAFFLMPCWPISTQRLDPVVSPGKISSHVHQIIGGDGFAPVMDYNTTQAADCTTCFVNGDKSNYWIPALYYQYQNGSFDRVPQVGSTSVYYFNEASRLGPGETMESFPEGLRMLAGTADKRTAGTDAASLAINYKCLNYAGTPTDSKTFPTSDCPDGVRAEVTFPSCWDGKNLDSSDHKSHMAYPTGTFESGACPSGYPHHLVTLKVEFIFDTHAYKDMWYGNSQPFIWSNGDTTGYGLHADYMMGWEQGLLEAAVAQCFDIYGVLGNCAPFNGRLPPANAVYANPKTCTLGSVVDEYVGGVVEDLPGCNAPGSEGKVANCVSEAKMKGVYAAAAVAVPASKSASPTASPSSTTSTFTLVYVSSSTTAPSSTSAPPSPTSSSSAPSSAAVSSDDSVVIVTVTDIVTETDYVTATSLVSSPPAASPTVSLVHEDANGKLEIPAAKVRRAVGDQHLYRHAHMHRRPQRREQDQLLDS